MLIVVVAAVLISAFGMWKVGLFQKLEFTTQEIGPISMVYVEHTGPYQKIGEKFDQVAKYLDENKIKYTQGIGEYLNSPQEVKQEDLKSNAGFIVDKPVKNLKEPFKFKTFEKKLYLTTSFKGSPAIGPFLVYPKSTAWMTQNNYELNGSCCELYKDKNGNNMTTEYLFGVAKKK